MWTEQHRKTYVRIGGRYPSDVTDDEWAHLEPLIPPAKPGGRPRQANMREALNAIFYLLRTGCPWRYLPRDGFPPRSTVYNIFRNFQRDGVWDAIWQRLHMPCQALCFVSIFQMVKPQTEPVPGSRRNAVATFVLRAPNPSGFGAGRRASTNGFARSPKRSRASWSQNVRKLRGEVYGVTVCLLRANRGLVGGGTRRRLRWLEGRPSGLKDGRKRSVLGRSVCLLGEVKLLDNPLGNVVDRGIRYR
jgi:transposase